ncbi:hypothetical protein HYPSUDRAFT_975312 [Hypholoma sublateritium FD-334 SS-4]|uniref:Uncharacterized protein n=1 Tax=Hypholoma sublateritium (strain FD-334 SS-4) TaxID=945553 RepID=A0A0D2PC73_HYPSF|nr:hypothetical protein HYPSUDRAFT_975312 [Hypholoma sublateritium FD-334 SS-4]
MDRLSPDSISLDGVVSTLSQPIKSRSGSSSQPLVHLQRWLSPGSYKRLVKGNKQSVPLDSFPKLVTVQTGNGYAESYARSLMMTGNGFPLWYPGGDLGKPIQYLQRGISIGDVGTLDRDGLFDFCFNIFLSPDNPIHSGLVPREFRPLEPRLDPSEVKTIPEYFTPGQVITSQGVDVALNPENSLKYTFSSLDPSLEGGILVLPNGASREDMTHTERIYEYAKRNAPYWYQDVNGYGGIVHANGSLFLVTGCDKASDWALASFPYYPGAKSCLNLQYNWQPDYMSPWIDHGTARTSYYAPPTSRPIPVEPDTRNQCIFVRGIRISLSAKSWRETMPASNSARLYYTFILPMQRVSPSRLCFSRSTRNRK